MARRFPGVPSSESAVAAAHARARDHESVPLPLNFLSGVSRLTVLQVRTPPGQAEREERTQWRITADHSSTQHTLHQGREGLSRLFLPQEDSPQNGVPDFKGGAAPGGGRVGGAGDGRPAAGKGVARRRVQLDHHAVLHHRPLLREGRRGREEERRREEGRGARDGGDEAVVVFADASEGEDPGALAGQEREDAKGHEAEKGTSLAMRQPGAGSQAEVLAT